MHRIDPLLIDKPIIELHQIKLRVFGLRKYILLFLVFPRLGHIFAVEHVEIQQELRLPEHDVGFH